MLEVSWSFGVEDEFEVDSFEVFVVLQCFVTIFAFCFPTILKELSEIEALLRRKKDTDHLGTKTLTWVFCNEFSDDVFCDWVDILKNQTRIVLKWTITLKNGKEGGNQTKTRENSEIKIKFEQENEPNPQDWNERLKHEKISVESLLLSGKPERLLLFFGK